MLYGMRNMAYSLFYERLGVNPEDVGLGYATTISRSTGFVVIAILISALVLLPAFWTSMLNRSWRRALERRVESNLQAQAAIDALIDAEALQRADKADVTPLVRARDTHGEAALEAESWMDRTRYSLRPALIFAIAALLLVVLPLAPVLALPRVKDVQKGRVVAPVRVLGVTVLAIRASPTEVQTTGKPSKPGETTAIETLRSDKLLYLGRTAATIVFYDSQSDRAVYVPASLVVLRVDSE
jgi:hypothetical protein